MAHNSQSGTILVVDDNADIQGFAKIFLEKAGYAVLTASDGEEGIRAYQQHRSSIILMLTDVAMPKMGGLELADRVLAMNSQLGVLLMSGDARCDYRGLECLAKPFRPAELIEIVNRVVNANTQLESAASATTF